MDMITQSGTITCSEILVSFNNKIIGTVNELEFSDGDCRYNLKKVIKCGE